MAWKQIPNEIVNDFRGKPLRHPRTDNDGDGVYKSFGCPAEEGCDQAFATIPAYREHWAEKHEGQPANVAITAERDDSRASDLIMNLLASLNARGSREAPNPLEQIRKTNDSHHATETWRRVSLAVERGEAIKLKDAQYDWLTQVLDRKLPVSKADKDAGIEQDTVAMFMWSLSADNVQQALKIVSERRVSEKDEDEAAA